jgi:hypothetical protein
MGITHPTSTGARSILSLLLAWLPADVITERLPVNEARAGFIEALNLIEYYRAHDCFNYAEDEDGNGGPEDEMLEIMADGGTLMIATVGWSLSVLQAEGWSDGKDGNLAMHTGLANGAGVYTAELFMLSKTAQNRDGAIAFLDHVMELDTQVAFHAAHGGIPAIAVDDPADITDATVRARYKEQQALEEAGAFVRMPQWLISFTLPTEVLAPFLDGPKGDIETDLTAEEVADAYFTKTETQVGYTPPK